MALKLNAIKQQTLIHEQDQGEVTLVYQNRHFFKGWDRVYFLHIIYVNKDTLRYTYINLYNIKVTTTYHLNVNYT